MDVEVKIWLQRLGMQNLVNVQKEAIRLDDALILSGMKSMKTPPTKEYLYGQKQYVDEEAKPTPKVAHFQNLTVFNDGDFKEPLLAKDGASKISGFCCMHIENDEEEQSNAKNLGNSCNMVLPHPLFSQETRSLKSTGAECYLVSNSLEIFITVLRSLVS